MNYELSCANRLCRICDRSCNYSLLIINFELGLGWVEDPTLLERPSNPEGLGEMMRRVLREVQLAVPIGIITRPNIASRRRVRLGHTSA